MSGGTGDVENSVSGGQQGIVVQGRDFHGPVTIYGGASAGRPQPARSAYWEHVRNIAPDQLRDRDDELAELADFCRGAGDHAFTWWRAGPWAGKSALLAWFALHPPEGVRVVPFFITARLAAQNDRSAFVHVVLEQLSELIGEPVPPQLTEATREAHLLRLFGRAAQECGERGERLVLLVDGLDEDRGATDGPDAHSVAGLVAQVPHDHDALRVVVAGRPHPPLPGDVPESHPLNRACTVRELAPSSWAGTVRYAAERELRRLFHAGGDHLDALGLLTAAGGGLSLDDLAHLTRAAPYRLQDVLRTASGRTFEIREGAYLLAHQELHLQARRLIGEAVLAEYRERLHAWAAEYQERGWPARTPPYLLHGYFAMLREHADIPRVVALATDPSRHERLYGDTGGDVATLAEIRAGEEAIVEAGGHPLPDLLRLAVQRHVLRLRNDAVPRELPVAWATLGYADRAEALALSIPGLGQRVRALVGVGEALRRRGDGERAVAVLRNAEAAVRPKDHSLDEPWHLKTLVTTWLAWGELERATALAAAISSPAVLESVVPLVTTALAEHGWYDRAEAFAEGTENLYVRVLGLLTAAAATAKGGEQQRADAFFRKAEEAVSQRAPYRSVGLLRRIAGAYAELGAHERGVAFAEGLAGMGTADSPSAAGRRITHAAHTEIALVLAGRGDAERALPLVLPELRTGIARASGTRSTPSVTTHALAVAMDRAAVTDDIRMQYDTCRVLIATGRHAEAEAMAHAFPHGSDRAPLALAFARAGESDRALRIAEGIDTGHAGSHAVTRAFCRTLIKQGRYEDAARAARHLTVRREVLGPVSLALAAAGQHAQALDLAEPAHGAAPEPVDLAWKCRVLLAVGQPGPAKTLAATIRDWTWRAVGLAAVARDLAAGGRADEAEAVLAQAESGYRDAAPLLSELRARAAVATALAGAGHDDRALTLLDGIEQRLPLFPGPLRSPRITVQHDAVARALTAAGQFERVLAMATVASEASADVWLVNVIRELADTGQPRLARALLPGLAKEQNRDRSRSDLAKLHVARGEFELALSLARASSTTTDLGLEMLAEIVEGLVRDGRREQAEELYRELLATPAPTPSPSCDTFTAIARAAYALGDHETVTAMFDRAERSGQLDYDARKSARFTRALVATGHTDRAETFVRGRTGPLDDGGSSLSGLVEALAESGDVSRAEALARSAPSSSLTTATACAALALALPRDRATKPAALAVHHGDWIKALPALLHADPTALDILTAPDLWPRLTSY
ncbi:hypothetical protein [Streptomyces formicae]|uniref:Uncharacterized protein n=1 Tax=Streptomyces formicae TaxID=1616117 RepID=A0A291QCD7_9ACTN|nr:hypothetical protein [Streptomyces formicae]ATL29176.1 hypothetical protein KY5_4158c [Streptomyces formicae]